MPHILHIPFLASFFALCRDLRHQVRQSLLKFCFFHMARQHEFEAAVRGRCVLYLLHRSRLLYLIYSSFPYAHLFFCLPAIFRHFSSCYQYFGYIPASFKYFVISFCTFCQICILESVLDPCCRQLSSRNLRCPPEICDTSPRTSVSPVGVPVQCPL